jgi:hypothetical protein
MMTVLDMERPWSASFPLLDTFKGENIRPQSFNKYACCEGDPVDNSDPSGQLIGAIGGLVGLMVGSIAAYTIDTRYNAAVTSAGISTMARLALWGAKVASPGIGLVAGYGLTAWQTTNMLEAQPLWKGPGSLPGRGDNVAIADWTNSIATILVNHVDAKVGLTPQQIADGHAGAELIAEAYVKAVQTRAITVFGIEGASNVMFGSGGGFANWQGNAVSWAISDSDRTCERWTMEIYDAMRVAGVTDGWKLRGHFGNLMAGDFSLGLLFKHNFLSLTFDPNNTGAAPAFILDPWSRARPDIYDFDTFNKLWPISSEQLEWQPIQN